MIERIEFFLRACGVPAAAERVSKYKGHPDWLDAL